MKPQPWKVVKCAALTALVVNVSAPGVGRAQQTDEPAPSEPSGEEPPVAPAPAMVPPVEDLLRELEEEDDRPGAPGAPVGEISEIDIRQLLIVPIIEAAAKRRQSLYEAPSAVTAFSAAQAVAHSPISIPDVLRAVPGVYVMQVNANAYNVGLRGYNGIGSNRFPVILDGRRTYDSAFGYPSWGSLPVNVGELDKIEVVRGPGSTLYGADALSGVIVLTSRDPLEKEGLEALLTSGIVALPDFEGDSQSEKLANQTRGYVGGTLLAGGKVGLRASVGFDHSPEWDDRAGPRFVGRNGPFGVHANLGAAAKLGEDATLRATASYSSTEIHEFVTTTSNDRVFEYDDIAGTLRFEKSRLTRWLSLTVHGDFTHSNKTSPIQATADMLSLDERVLLSTHGLVQLDASLWGGRNVLTLGGETSWSNADFEFVGISPSSFYVAGFLQNETRLLENPGLLLNVGLRLERVENSDEAHPELFTRDGTYTYPSISPRASLIFRPARAHSVRLSAATGSRLPQIFENFATARVGMFDPPYFTLIANPSVEPETVRSIEIGYRGKPFPSLRLDAAVYAQQLRDMVALRRAQIPVAYENAFDLDQLGVELGAQFRVGRRVTGHLSYGFQTGDATSKVPGEDPGELVPEHIASAGLNLHFGATLIGGNFYYASAYTPTFLTFLNQRPVLDSERIAPQTNLSLRASRRVSRTTEAFAYGTNLLAFGRDRDDLRQYATDFAYPIGATIVIGVRVISETIP
jgi:outer membrane receptor protein involved in Fe transport